MEGRLTMFGLRRLWCNLTGIMLLALAAIAHAQEQTDPKSELGLVFSVKSWVGDYSSKDVPGGVETTPVIGAIWTINADGSGLSKIAQLGKNTDYPTFSPDGRWVYFQSNALGRSQVYRCRPDGSGTVNLTEGDRVGKRWSS